MPGLHGILAAGVPVYGVLLMTMIWRATARVQFFQVSIIMHSGARLIIMLMIEKVDIERWVALEIIKYEQKLYVHFKINKGIQSPVIRT